LQVDRRGYRHALLVVAVTAAVLALLAAVALPGAARARH
jgi:hypothetical protein